MCNLDEEVIVDKKKEAIIKSDFIRFAMFSQTKLKIQFKESVGAS